jgi:hypothetical protein
VTRDQLAPLVGAYLQKNLSTLRFTTIDGAMFQLKLWVAGARDLSDSELRGLVLDFYIVNNLLTIPSLPPPPTGPDNSIVESVKKAVTSVIEGVEIKRGDNKIIINVKGLTAELTRGTSVTSVNVNQSGMTGQVKQGDTTVSSTVGWDGTLTVSAQKKNMYLTGEISKDRWKITLSYPSDTSVPSLDKLGKVFTEGEKAFRGIVKETQGIKHIKDVERVTTAIKPYMDPVKNAVEAAQGLAAAQTTGLSVGFSLGSPDPLPGQTGRTPGIQGTATLTFSF